MKAAYKAAYDRALAEAMAEATAAAERQAAIDAQLAANKRLTAMAPAVAIGVAKKSGASVDLTKTETSLAPLPTASALASIPAQMQTLAEQLTVLTRTVANLEKGEKRSRPDAHVQGEDEGDVGSGSELAPQGGSRGGVNIGDGESTRVKPDAESMRVKPRRSSKSPMAYAHHMLAELTAEESAVASEQRIEYKKRRAGLQSVLWHSE